MTDKTVEKLLEQHGVPFRISGRDFVTNCFNTSHTDTNPSFRIDRITGVAHCFSCGHRLNIFTLYGQPSNNASVRTAKLKEKLRVLNVSTNGLKELEGSVPFNGTHRDISSQTLKQFGAFKTDKVYGMEDRIIFPIKDVRGKVTAYVGRHTKSDGNPRYQIHPTGAQIPLYPTKLEGKHYSIVLVEGLFDLLNVYDKGLKNVVCTFGVDGLTNHTAEKLLPFKAMGVSKIFIMYDGDNAGREAAAKLSPIIEEAGFIVEIVPMEEGTDPGNMVQDDVNSMITYTQ
jgi:DNA primase